MKVVSRLFKNSQLTNVLKTHINQNQKRKYKMVIAPLK